MVLLFCFLIYTAIDLSCHRITFKELNPAWQYPGRAWAGLGRLPDHWGLVCFHFKGWSIPNVGIGSGRLDYASGIG